MKIVYYFILPIVPKFWEMCKVCKRDVQCFEASPKQSKLYSISISNIFKYLCFIVYVQKHNYCSYIVTI